MLSIVKLKEINGEPAIKLDLPRLHLGDPVRLRFAIQRSGPSGRVDRLEVDSLFRVTALGVETTTVPHRQLVSVEPTGPAPTWRSVKKEPTGRRLGPCKFEPTDI